MTQPGSRPPGSGRKAGTANVKTREIADRAIAEGITPLEVMLKVMREQWDAYQTLKEQTGDEADPAATAAAAKAASDAAKDAAPYIHPRLGNVDPTVDIGPITGSLSEQAGVVLEAISEGKLTPGQGATIMQAISSHARIIEVDELEKRISRIEKDRAHVR
jgi:hypothetical protein